jgi:two-component system, OmpR family, sensor histidine kinase TctE
MFSRFFEWMLAPLLFVWLVSFAATFIAARASADKTHDVRLVTVAKLLDSEWQIVKNNEKKEGFPSAQSVRWLNASSDSPLRYAIVDSQWRKLSGDDELAQAANQPLGSAINVDQPEQSNLSLDGVVHRIVLLNNATNETIVLAQNRQEGDALVRTIVMFEVIPQALILLIAGLLVAYGLAYVAKPLTELQALLSQRSANQLDPIAKPGLPQELEPFLDGLNGLLQRLETTISAQRRFIADAAHQLRTPIAAMLNESQLLSRLESPSEKQIAIERLQAISERTSRLATQLLSLARAESSSANASFDLVNICQIVRLVAEDVASDALVRGIEIELDLRDDVWMHKADTTLVGEMVRNLIDNAICYTPKGGQVVISVNPYAKQIAVDDSGVGIPQDEREAVFAPFFRGNNLGLVDRANGSGLGLAIVKEVAVLHNATVTIGDSMLGGARVVVSFR